MGQEANGIDDIRSELGKKVAAFGALGHGITADDLARDLDQIRRIAHANGMMPAVTVAHALESALARGERGPLILGWLDILSDAIGCHEYDARACDTYAAACSVRYG